MTQRLPNLVILGAQKSATSFVQHCIDAHPDVFVVRREIALFEDGEFDPSGLAALARELPAARRTVRWFGIKRPDYLAMPGVPARLAEHLAEARLIAVLRHPIERLVSAYYHYVRYSFLPNEPLATGVRRALDEHGGDAAGGFSPRRALLDYGLYARALERYREHFVHDRLAVFLHEDLRADPERAYGAILAFLGLERRGERPPFDRRQNVGVYDPSRIALLRAVQAIACRVDPLRNRWGYRLGALGMALYGAWRIVDKGLLARVRPNRPATLPADLRARLIAFYADDLTRLEHLLGRDLSDWRS